MVYNKYYNNQVAETISKNKKPKGTVLFMQCLHEH